ncbi:hypothetical protein IFR05_011703 [Cadophora sp. M221]|nr:hypothetical protein IFR05_011703 [Cadophora sp. M221]
MARQAYAADSLWANSSATEYSSILFKTGIMASATARETDVMVRYTEESWDQLDVGIRVLLTMRRARVSELPPFQHPKGIEPVPATVFSIVCEVSLCLVWMVCHGERRVTVMGLDKERWSLGIVGI